MNLHLYDPETYDYFDLQSQYDPGYVNTIEIVDEVYNTSALKIRMLAMDFPSGTTPKHRKELEAKWISILPTLDNVRVLEIRHLADNDFLEAICQMKNLEWLSFETSRITDLRPLSRLPDLKKLQIRSSKLTDISHLLTLRNLDILSIDASFNVSNYDLIGNMHWLKALQLSGDRFAPKTLKLQSLLPYTSLKELIHLSLPVVSIADKGYDSILHMPALKRLDMTKGITTKIAVDIKGQHPSLTFGSFVNLDHDKPTITTLIEAANDKHDGIYRIESRFREEQ